MNINIVYIGRYCFGSGAAWTRVENIAKIFNRNGCDTYFVSNAKQLQNFKLDNHHISVPYRSNKLSSLINLFDLLTGMFEGKTAIRLIKKVNAKKVVLYNESFALSRRIISYCHNHKIQVFADVTEWYEITPIKHGIADFIYTRSVNRRIKKLDSRLDGVIAISPFMQNYYNDFDLKTILIPPLFFDDIKTSKEVSKKNRMSVVYAGSPATKDLIIPVLNAIYKINQKTIHINFNLVGLSKEDIMQLWGKENLEKLGIYCYGRQSREKAIEIVQESGFTILLRKNERYAKAGYSTKLAESLYVGTPVICNLVGGADSEIVNGETGFVLSTSNEDDVYKLLLDITLMEEGTYKEMSAKASLFGKNRYKSSLYDSSLMDFLL